MALGTIFANQPTGNVAASLLDTNFNQVGAMAVTACTATGTNAITLALNTNQPNVTAYANYQLFSFVAVANSTGSVTVNINSVGALPLYIAGGTVQAANGAITSGTFYIIAYNLALNSGSGGFVIISNPTGSGSTGTGLAVFATSPTLVTPILGVATATSLNFGGTALATYQTGTWTPTDASGASLSLTVNAASYTKIGRVVLLEGNIVYPSTASGSSASIGGLPYPSASTSNVVYVGQSMSTFTTSVIVPTINSNVSTMGFNTANGTTAITNANLSTKQVYFTILYEASTN